MAPHATFEFGEESDPCPYTPGEFHGHGVRDNSPASKNSDLVEPIAIVGFSFKFPRDADATDSFWSMLMEKRSTATKFPKDRISASSLYHPDPNRRDAVNIPALDTWVTSLCNVASANMNRYHSAVDILFMVTLLRSTLRFSLSQTPKQLIWIHNNEGSWKRLIELWRMVS